MTRGPLPFPAHADGVAEAVEVHVFQAELLEIFAEGQAPFHASWKVGAGIFAMATLLLKRQFESVLRKSSDVLTQGSALSCARVCSTTGETVKLSIKRASF